MNIKIKIGPLRIWLFVRDHSRDVCMVHMDPHTTEQPLTSVDRTSLLWLQCSFFPSVTFKTDPKRTKSTKNLHIYILIEQAGLVTNQRTMAALPVAAFERLHMILIWSSNIRLTATQFSVWWERIRKLWGCYIFIWHCQITRQAQRSGTSLRRKSPDCW